MKEYLMFFRGAISFVIFLSIFIPFSMDAQDDQYVASKFSIKYHKPNCKKVPKIQTQNKVTFNTGKQALDAGYVPCTICKPPTQDSNKETQQVLDTALEYYITRY